MRAVRVVAALALGLAVLPAPAHAGGQTCSDVTSPEPFWVENPVTLTITEPGDADAVVTLEPTTEAGKEPLRTFADDFSVKVGDDPTIYPADLLDPVALSFVLPIEALKAALDGDGFRLAVLHDLFEIFTGRCPFKPAEPPAIDTPTPTKPAPKPEPKDDGGLPWLPIGLGVGGAAALGCIALLALRSREDVTKVSGGDEGEPGILGEYGPSGGCRCAGMEVKLDEDLPGEAIKGADVLDETITFRVCFRIRCHCSGRIGDTCVCGLSLRRATVTTTPGGTFGADLSHPDTVNAHVVQHCTNVGEQGAPARACAQIRVYSPGSFRGPAGADAPPPLGAVTGATVEWEFEKLCDGPAGRVLVTTAHTWSGASLAGTTTVVSSSGI